MAFPVIRVISRDNGVGLTRDLALMADTLEAGGVPVQRVGFKSRRLRDGLRESGLWLSRALGGRVPLQLFSERVYPRCLPLGQRNVLVPNPEWLLPKWLPYLPEFELVLCKTHHAERIFRNLGCRTRFIGFTSETATTPRCRGGARSSTWPGAARPRARGCCWRPGRGIRNGRG